MYALLDVGVFADGSNTRCFQIIVSTDGGQTWTIAKKRTNDPRSLESALARIVEWTKLDANASGA